MKLYPIINLNLDESSFSVQDISGIYDFLINAISKSEDKDSLEALEFSLACPQLYTNLPNIIAKLKEANIPLALASLISVDQVLDLKSTLEGILIEPIEIFSPAFDDDIAKLIQADSFMQRYFNYIPGVYSESDIDEVLKFNTKSLFEKSPDARHASSEDTELTETSMSSPRNEHNNADGALRIGSKIKVYPMDIGTPQSLLETLQGPYPELRTAKLRSRIITVTDELALKYQPYEKLSTNPNLVVVTSPRDYQKIRKDFILRTSMRLVFKPLVRDPQDLVNYIKAASSDTSIVIAGLGADLKRAKSLQGVEFIATRMFKSVLFDMLSGAISDNQAQERIREEIEK